MPSGTSAIAGLHVPATQVVCIEKDQEVFELAKERVERFKDGKKFMLPEAYGIFATVKLIPQNGAFEAAGVISEVADGSGKQENSDEGESEDLEEEPGEILGDEEVDILDLFSCRLKLRPTHECCVYGGYLDSFSGSLIEANRSGNLQICQSRIEGAGKGVFATANISEGAMLLPYWGDVYVIPNEAVASRVAELNTDRLVKTKKHIKNGAQKQL